MEFFTWQFLATFAGCAIGTGVLVQLFKTYIKIPTQLFSYIVAFAIYNGAALALGNWDIACMGIAVLNAGLIALASNGGFEAVNKIIAKFQKPEVENE